MHSPAELGEKDVDESEQQYAVEQRYAVEPVRMAVAKSDVTDRNTSRCTMEGTLRRDRLGEYGAGRRDLCAQEVEERISECMKEQMADIPYPKNCLRSSNKMVSRSHWSASSTSLCRGGGRANLSVCRGALGRSSRSSRLLRRTTKLSK